MIPFPHADGASHHLDADDQPRVVLPLARYTHLLAVEAAAIAHSAELEALVAAETAHAGPHSTPAGRHGAMATLLLRRRGVVESVAELVEVVGR